MSALNCVTVPVATSRKDFNAAPSACCSSVTSRTPLEMMVCVHEGRHDAEIRAASIQINVQFNICHNKDCGACMAGAPQRQLEQKPTLFPMTTVLVVKVAWTAVRAGPAAGSFIAVVPGAAAGSAVSEVAVVTVVSSFCTRHVMLPTVMLSTQGTEGTACRELPAIRWNICQPLCHTDRLFGTSAFAVAMQSLSHTSWMAVMTRPAGQCTSGVHGIGTPPAFTLQQQQPA